MKMLNRIFLAVLLLPALLFGAANDLRLPQKNAADTAWVDRIFAGESAISTTLASYRSAIGLGTEDSPTWTAITLSGATPITLAGGGTITAASGAISLVASGTAQHITLTPSTTGMTKFVQASTTNWLGAVPSAATFGGLWLGQATPSASNSVLNSAGTHVQLNAQTALGHVDITGAGTLRARFALTTGNLLLGGLTTDGTGVLQFPTSTTNAGGITMGTDIHFYRNAAGQATLYNSGGAVRFYLGSSTSTAHAYLATSSADVVLDNLQNGGIIFATNNTTALTIDASQRTQFASQVGIGAGPTGATALDVRSTLAGTDQIGILSAATFGATGTATVAAFNPQVITTNASFTTTSAFGINISAPSKGASNTITTLYGLHIGNQSVGGTNYSIYTNAGNVRFGSLAGSGTRTVVVDANGILSAP